MRYTRERGRKIIHFTHRGSTDKKKKNIEKNLENINKIHRNKERALKKKNLNTESKKNTN